MSIFSWFLGRFSNDLYIQIWENRIKISCIGSSCVYDDVPLVAIQTNASGVDIIAGIGRSCSEFDSNQYQIINPFSHPRTLLSDFYVAEKLLQHAVREIHNSRQLKPAPRVIFHPMEKIEGGITNVEYRAYQELCAGAGARKTVIHVGAELQVQGLHFDSVSDVLSDKT